MRRLTFVVLYSALLPHVVWAAKHPLAVATPLRPPPVRILMAKNLDHVTLYGKDLRKIMHEQNNQKILSGERGVRFECKHSGERQQKDILFASLTTPGTPIRFNDNRYLGQMHLWVNQRGQCQLVHELGLEEYVESLLPAEMNKKWPLEVLKAQAVAARTYALFKIQHNSDRTIYDLENSEKDQVNGGLNNLNARTKQGQAQTFGEVLTEKDGRLGPIFYHASCGGRTLTAQMVWGNSGNGYTSRPCPCGGRDDHQWQALISEQRMQAFLQSELKLNESDLIGELVDPGERFSFLQFETAGRSWKLSKPAFRKYFGRVEIASNNFKVERVARGFQIKGKGKGHGVGMCQIGALDLAKTGMDYKKILAHYFPNHELKKIY